MCSFEMLIVLDSFIYNYNTFYVKLFYCVSIPYVNDKSCHVIHCIYRFLIKCSMVDVNRAIRQHCMGTITLA